MPPPESGQKLIAAVKHHNPQFTARDLFPRYKRAMKGYRKKHPLRSRPPFCKELVALLVSGALALGHRDAALRMMTCFVGYLRPGEARRLLVQHLLQPMRRHGALAKWAIVIAPQNDDASEPQVLSKTGTMDETVILDHPAWLGPALANHCKGRDPQALLFTTSAETDVSVFQQILQRVGLRKMCLYQLRHAGASEDLCNGLRSFPEVKARGRWLADSSVRRYAKPATLQRIFATLSPSHQNLARFQWDNLQDIVEGGFPPALP